MLRDKMIDHWVEELDREIYDLLDLREEVAGERLVIEDGTDRRCAMAAPSDEVRIINVPSEEINVKEILEAVDIDYAEALARLKAQRNLEKKAYASVPQ